MKLYHMPLQYVETDFFWISIGSVWCFCTWKPLDITLVIGNN